MNIISQVISYMTNNMSPVEMVATIFWLLSVYFTVKQNIWCWPTGVIMVSLYAYIFFGVKLYSDAILQVIYFFLQFYGWYVWLYGGKNKTHALIRMISWRQRIIYLFIAILGTIFLWSIMHYHTDASFPYIDAGMTAFSLVAQWLLSKKILENWIIWIGVDLVSICVYYSKELYLTSWLYLIFLILAIIWCITWIKEKKLQVL